MPVTASQHRGISRVCGLGLPVVDPPGGRKRRMSDVEPERKEFLLREEAPVLPGVASTRE